MPTNKKVNGGVKLAPNIVTVAYLEISTDGGINYSIVDSMVIQPNINPTIYNFPNKPIIDVDDPMVRVKIRIATQTTTTTSSTSTSTTTLAPTTSTTSTSTTTFTSSTTTSTTQSPSGNIYTLTPNGQNRLVIDNSNNFYQPGDTLQLRGDFLSVEVYNLTGAVGSPVTITNYPNEITTIGDVLWNGGGYSFSMPVQNCHYLVIKGQDKDHLIFEGSTQSQRTAYNIFYASEFTDNLEVYNFTLRNGGTGFVCKTNPTTDPATQYPNTTLSNFSFHDAEIYNTLHEALYIGHTATYWDLTSNAPFYGTIGDTSTGWISGHNYVQPLMLTNVEIYNMNIHDVGYDGIQTAATNNLEIWNCDVQNYGTGEHAGDVSGICDGGRNTNVYIHDNLVHDGHGEFMYIFGAGNNHIIYNNLFYNNKTTSTLTPVAEGLSIRGTDSFQAQINNNTIATIANVAIRINSSKENGTILPMLINANAIMAPRSGNNANSAGTIFDPQSYFYVENGGTYTLGTNSNVNTKFTTVAAANVDVNNYYQPNTGSPLNASGYRRDPSGTTTSTTSTSTSSTTTLTSTSSTTTTTTTNDGSSNFFSITGWDSNQTAQGAWIYTPPGYNPSNTSTEYPWAIFLHGQGESGNNLSLLSDPNRGGPGKYFAAGDEPQGYIVMIPQLYSGYGTWEPSIIDRAYNYMVSNYNVDTNRFCLNGLSLGGSGTAKYVSQNPNKVACYFTMTADLSFIRSNVDTTVGGIRVADVPCWFHNGIADSTIDVGNVSQTIDYLLGTSGTSVVKPYYPPNADEYWGLGHANNMWDDKGYNRKNRTDTTGTAVWDWIDWSKQFEINNPLRAATSFVVQAEQTLNLDDYLYALNQVDKLNSSSEKTNLLNRLITVKTNIDTIKIITVIDFGSSTSTISNINKATASGTNGTLSNLIDFNGNNTGSTFTVTTDRWGNGTTTNTLTTDFHGFDSAMNSDSFRIYGTSNTIWTVSGLIDGSNYNFKFYYNDTNQNKTLQSGCNITIGSTTQQALNPSYNTTRYLTFSNVTPTSGNVVITMNAFLSNWQGDITVLVIEKIIDGLTTTTTSSTSTTTTSTTIIPTTTTTTTIAPTTTTTTTSNGLPVAKFNFNLTSQSISGFMDMSGDQTANTISQTQNGITVSNIPSNWQAFSTFSGDNDGGMSTGTFGSNFPLDVVRSYWLNYAMVWTGANYNMQITGLNPSSTYKIEIIGSVKNSVNNNVTTEYNLVNNGVNQQQLLNCVDNTQNTITFNNVVPDGTGKILFGVNKKGDSSAGDFGLLNGLIVTALT